MILVLVLIGIAFSAPRVDKKSMQQVAQKKNDVNKEASKTPYAGELSGAYDKSVNGYGWYLGHNRKIQVYSTPTVNSAGSDVPDPVMVGSIYRQKNDAGSGTAGGMIGEWNGATLNSYTTTVQDVSLWDGMAPGARYPQSAEFINGYFFGSYNDFNQTTQASTQSFPVFVVADATWGADWTTWSAPTIVTATDGSNAIIPGAWTNVGDVVYSNPAIDYGNGLGDGYYYWTQCWETNDINSEVKSLVMGRSETPAVPASWDWTNYTDLSFDPATSDILQIEYLNTVYCKDAYGNGTGYGITLTVVRDQDDLDAAQAIDPTLTVDDIAAKISYQYTTNYGADDSSGDFAPNWINDGGKPFQIEYKDLFDWYGSIATEIDTVTVDPLVIDSVEVVMDDPWISWDIQGVATEHNAVHVMLKCVFVCTKDPTSPFYDSYWYGNDYEYMVGIYHLKGEISDTGVQWNKANLVASMIGQDDELGTEGRYINRAWHSIGYAGYGQIYTAWLDRPANNPTDNLWIAGGVNETWFIDDAFFAVSADDGFTWEIDSVGVRENEMHPESPYLMKYATNLTNTDQVHEEGWSVANHGSIIDGQLEVYGVYQHYDVDNHYPSPVEYYDYEQFLHVFKITGTVTSGIETEEVAINMDFELMQNYPNPFNPTTEISFRIRDNANVKLTVFNSNGETVVRLADGKMEKGLHRVNFDASRLNSGVYFYQLDVNGMKSTKKMVLAK